VTTDARTRVWLGTAGWAYEEWVGAFYPEGTSSSEMLHRYVEAFRCVEIDSTFYAAPAPATVARWADIMPAEFRVTAKAPKALVQETALHPPEVPFRHFHEQLAGAFGNRLAAVVVQMQPSFRRTPANDVALRAFLDRWAPHVPLAVELRDPSWHTVGTARVFAEHDVTWVSVDLHDVPSLGMAAHDTSARLGYLRLIGRHDGMPKDRISRPQDHQRHWWVERVAAMAARGVRDVIVIVNNHYEGHAPATLRILADELTAAGQRVVASPGWPDGQVGLF
jgi:uncharacterized protein YecE (DUF72 family)